MTLEQFEALRRGISEIVEMQMRCFGLNPSPLSNTGVPSPEKPSPKTPDQASYEALRMMKERFGKVVR